MSISNRFLAEHASDYAKNWGTFLVIGILMMAAGFFAVSAMTFTTLVTVMVIGFMLLFAGCVIFLDTFTFWRGRDHGFILHLAAAILYLAAGTLLITNPVAGSMTITFMIGIIYTLIGITRIFFTTAIRLPHWGWAFANGIITLILGILILASWPASSIYIIGLFVGIDIFFCGLAYTMTALALRGNSKRKKR